MIVFLISMILIEDTIFPNTFISLVSIISFLGGVIYFFLYLYQVIKTAQDKLKHASIITISIITFFFVAIISSPISNSKKETDKPLSNLVILELTKNCNISVMINTDSVWIEPFENVSCNTKRPFGDIDKTTYPNLFKQGVANSSFISVKKSDDLNYPIVISNNQPDHGGYIPTYQLLINPTTGDVKELTD